MLGDTLPPTSFLPGLPFGIDQAINLALQNVTAVKAGADAGQAIANSLPAGQLTPDQINAVIGGAMAGASNAQSITNNASANPNLSAVSGAAAGTAGALTILSALQNNLDPASDSVQQVVANAGTTVGNTVNNAYESAVVSNTPIDRDALHDIALSNAAQSVGTSGLDITQWVKQVINSPNFSKYLPYVLIAGLAGVVLFSGNRDNRSSSYAR